jgi:hypothetical protein
MAILFLSLDGIGLGHLSRSFEICRALKEIGERPVIFSQGIYPPHFEQEIPGKIVPTLWQAAEEERAEIARHIVSYVSLSRPAAVLEDTHPAPIKLPSNIRRFLFVRPTVFSHMLFLKNQFSDGYEHFFICDAPDSPTWPYTEKETDELQRWERWSSIGPVFRTASAEGARFVEERYKFKEGQRIYVYTMGGGGRQYAGDQDFDIFLERAVQLADSLRSVDPDCRLIFVRGPFFPARIKVPAIFESVREEPYMPELLCRADGAIIRPGFNTIWECLRAGIPFTPIFGTTHVEPVRERLSSLREAGIVCDDLASRGNDPQWRNEVRQLCAGILKRRAGRPDLSLLRKFLSSRQGTGLRPEPAVYSYEEQKEHERGEKEARELLLQKTGENARKLLVRVDDVVGLDDDLLFVLKMCRDLEVFASLEVVPYLFTLSDSELDRIDGGRIFEVSQHGYAHLPVVRPNGRKCEFSPTGAPSEITIGQLRRGFSMLRAAFPQRFRGGYSPPFDGLADWLPAVWRNIGGSYLSLIWAFCKEPAMPVVRVETEFWDWETGQPYSLDTIIQSLLSGTQKAGHAGLVVHPQLMKDHSNRELLKELLTSLISGGFRSVPLSSCVSP